MVVHKANTKRAAERIAKQIGKGAKIAVLDANERALLGCKYLVGKVKKRRRRF